MKILDVGDEKEASDVDDTVDLADASSVLNHAHYTRYRP